MLLCGCTSKQWVKQEVDRSVSKLDTCRTTQESKVSKHFYVEILYTETSKVICVLACMHTASVFSKIDALNIWCLIIIRGIRPTMICVCLRLGLWVYEYLSFITQWFLPANPILLPTSISCSFSIDTQVHTFTHSDRRVHTCCRIIYIYVYIHTAPFSCGPPLHTTMLTTSITVIWCDWEAELFLKVWLWCYRRLRKIQYFMGIEKKAAQNNYPAGFLSCSMSQFSLLML